MKKKLIRAAAAALAALAVVGPAQGAFAALPPLPVTPPALPDTSTVLSVLQTQINNMAHALQETPSQVLATVLNLEVPTPQGAVDTLSVTVQELVDRVAGTDLFAADSNGILGLPEVSVGQVYHQFLWTATLPKVTVPTCVAPAKLEPCTLAPDPTANRINEIPQYHVSTSQFVPSTPLVPGLNPVILLPAPLNPPPALPIATPGLTQPLLLLHWGGPLINVRGGGWVSPTTGAPLGVHSAGSTALGANADTAFRPWSIPGDPYPIYLPVGTSNDASLTANTKKLKDSAIDFIGTGLPITTKSCTNLGAKTKAIVNGVSMTTYPSAFCLSFGLLLADGVAIYNKSPLNFHDDLLPLWSPAPPPVSAASAAIAAILGLVTVPPTPSLPPLPTVP